MPPARRILVLHGPNLNLLPGARSLEAIDAALHARAVALGVELKTFQSNWEGGLLDTLAAERNWFEAVIVNPASLAPTAVGLAEALKLLKRPAIEVQLDEMKKGRSALKDVVEKQIFGKGPEGYLEALVALAPRGATKNLGARVVAAALTEATSVVRGAARPAIADASSSVRSAARPALTDASSVVRGAARPALLSRGLAPKTQVSETVTDKTIGRVLPSGEILKTIGSGRQRLLAKLKPPPPSAPPRSSGGRGPSTPESGVLTRTVVRQQIADRLSGVVTPSSLSAWARAQWQKLQSGAPIESGQREKLEDVLQQLLLSATAKTSDDQLIELMTQLAE